MNDMSLLDRMFGKTTGGRIEFEVEIRNSLGLHARPASMIVQVASRFESEILVIKDGKEINGKSLMGVLMLAAGKGSRLKLVAEGSDAQMAHDALRELIEKRMFDEV